MQIEISPRSYKFFFGKFFISWVWGKVRTYCNWVWGRECFLIVTIINFCYIMKIYVRLDVPSCFFSHIPSNILISLVFVCLLTIWLRKIPLWWAWIPQQWGLCWSFWFSLKFILMKVIEQEMHNICALFYLSIKKFIEYLQLICLIFVFIDSLEAIL